MCTITASSPGTFQPQTPRVMIQDVKDRSGSLFPGSLIIILGEGGVLGDSTLLSSVHSSVKTVHSVSVGWDRIACEGVSLKLPASGPFSGLWFAEILSRTKRKPYIHCHTLLFIKMQIESTSEKTSFQILQKELSLGIRIALVYPQYCSFVASLILDQIG